MIRGRFRAPRQKIRRDVRTRTRVGDPAARPRRHARDVPGRAPRTVGRPRADRASGHADHQSARARATH